MGGRSGPSGSARASQSADRDRREQLGGRAPSPARRCAGCPGGCRTSGRRARGCPSRPMAPGTRVRYQAKSSPPRLCAVGARPSGPSTASTARPSSATDAGVVDHRRDAALVVDRGLHAVRRHDLARRRCGSAAPCRSRRPRRASGRCRRALPASGITLVARPASTPPPHHADAGPRVEPAGEHGRQLGDELGQREGEVLGQVRPAGVAAAPGQPDLEAVGGTGDRALAQPDPADVDGRVAVQAEDPARRRRARRGPSAAWRRRA